MRTLYFEIICLLSNLFNYYVKVSSYFPLYSQYYSIPHFSVKLHLKGRPVNV